MIPPNDSLRDTLRLMSTFKRTPKGVRLVDDRGDLIVEWRNGCVPQPETHEQACEQAALVIRERTGAR